MPLLPSGLDEAVADDEDLARFLTSASQFTTVMPKPSAFMPSPRDLETSVFRHGAAPSKRLWQIGDEHAAGDRNLHGVAIVKAGVVREIRLLVIADEPPPRHAAIRGWPLNGVDPDLQKAEQKKLAGVIAGKAELFRR